ncbi:MAG: nickel-dependent hydrogenase large subunit [Chloroflexi bacterium]|nr:nickel-dependent hydrogenase large subunit [Chloroflexota bacterium]
MAQRVVVDPITRIEGHLRIEAEVDENNVIRKAYSSGTMVRGIEIIMRGRDPRSAWAITQRSCGVCTTVHAFASIRAVEDALDIRIPKNANLIRNLMIAQQFVHDHVMHFYHLHALDWVDVVNALKADPKETARIARSISSWPKTSPAYFAAVQNKVKEVVESGQLTIFANAYWGHPAYKLPPEIDLLAVAHYLEALDAQRDFVRIHTIFGGKNPHPNFLVGGVPFPIDPNSDKALNAHTLAIVGDTIQKMKTFVHQVYLPDVLAIAPFYKEYATLGEGLGNFLVWGEFPADDIRNTDSYLVPRGAILDRDLSTVHPVDPTDMDGVQEFVAHSWYEYSKGDDVGLHPWEGETKLHYTGPKPPYEYLNVEEKYSWLKSPRWKERPMEVGPLARVLVLYASGHPQAKELVETTLKALDAPADALFSTLGRTAARAIETAIYVDAMEGWYNELIANIAKGDYAVANTEKWDPKTWPKHAQGVGTTEAPRGALGHWVVIDDGKITNYQQVVPTTWNASPRDHKGQAGAYERSLEGTKLAIPDQPVEILRTIHSFDPCMACAVHMIDANQQVLGTTTVMPSTVVQMYSRMNVTTEPFLRIGDVRKDAS